MARPALRAPTVFPLLVLVLAAGVGYLGPTSERLAVLLVLFAAAVGLSAAQPAAVAVLAVPGVFALQRLGAVDISFTDVIVSAAAVLAFASGAHRSLSRQWRLLATGFGFYLLTLSISLLANPSIKSDLEFAHRVFLVAGSILVGAWLVRAGLHTLALRLLLAAVAVISLAAVVVSASSGFSPAYPLGYHKNFVGSVGATTLIVLLAAGEHVRLPPWLYRVSVGVVVAGLLAAQSRGGILAAALGLGIWFFRSGAARRKGTGKVVVVVALIFAGVVGLSVKTQFEQRVVTGNQIDSLSQRADVEGATRDLWLAHPLTGVGVRFFKVAPYVGSYEAPNNVLNEILAEAGFVGLLGFLVFVAASMTALARAPGSLALAGLAVVGARFLHGLLDIYWIGGTTTLPWLIAGMGLGAAFLLEAEPVRRVADRASV